MKKNKLEEGQSIFKEIENDQYTWCGGCGHIRLKESLRMVVTQKWSSALCPECRERMCEKCKY